MLLLTGATGTIGSALLRRLTAGRTPVRVLVRDPRRLGPERVRVQIALGDLAEPASFRHALRGVRAVVHLASPSRDQPHATIEELNALGTWKLLRAAEAARVERFVFVSPLGATPHHPARMHRAKAVADRAVAASDLRTDTLRTSFVYAPGTGWLQRLERFALLPAVPLTAGGRATIEPVWADDVADCILAALDAEGPQHAEHEIAGPERMTVREFADLALTGARRRRPLLGVPAPLMRQGLRVHEALAGPAALATWAEAQLFTVDALSVHGTAGARALGVTPRAPRAVLAPRA